MRGIWAHSGGRTHTGSKESVWGRKAARESERILVIGFHITTLTNHNSRLMSRCHNFQIPRLISTTFVFDLRWTTFSTLIRLIVNQTFVYLEKNGRRSKGASESPKARHSKLPDNCEGQHRQAGHAATGWDLFPLVKGDMLAAIFHHRLVLNPSKSVSLWQHTCASSYQGLWQSNFSSASVALLQSRRVFLPF